MEAEAGSVDSFLHRIWKALILFLLAGSAYILALAFYNLFFHPIRQIPGPLLARVSRLWARIGNLKGCKSERIHDAHQRYGAVVRVGPNEISFADPAAVREIYSSDNFVKEETFYRAKRVFHENHMFSFRNAEAHKQRRKLLSRGFSQSAMLDFESSMSTKIQMMLDKWAQLTTDDAQLDIYPWCHWLGFDTVYHLMFDEDPGSIKSGQPHEVMRYIKAWRPTFIYKEFMPRLEQWGPFVPGRVGGYFRDVQTWKNFATKLIRSCREKGTKTPFLRYALTDPDAYLGRPLTDSELAEECMGGMFGRSGTTANTFVYLIWAVAHDTLVMKKLGEELKSAFPKDTVPEYTLCSKLPYLQAVINETLRRYPTIIATLPRTALQDTAIQGTPIPKGTIVGTQNYTIHRNANAFPNPEQFQPDRWLDDSDSPASKDADLRGAAFTPFGVGSRKCVGINLAQMELCKLTASFFRRFTVSIDDSMCEEDMRMYDTFNAGPAGGRVVVRLQEVAE